MSTHIINFRDVDRDIFNQVKEGNKKVETRAATEKYRDIKKGDVLRFVCGDRVLEKEVKSSEIFTSIESLLEKYNLEIVMPGVLSLEDAIKRIYSFPDYESKIKEFGLIAWEI